MQLMAVVILLVSLKRTKSALHIPEAVTEYDDHLTFYIASASEAIEKECRRSFVKKEYTEICSGINSRMLAVSNYPVHEVLEIRSDSGKIYDYHSVLDECFLFSPEGWPDGEYNLTARYIGGYVLPSDNPNDPEPDLPQSLQMACLMLVKMMYSGEWGKQQERIGDYSVTYAKAEKDNRLPGVVSALISPYVRRWNVR